MFIFNRENVYLANTVKDFDKVRSILDDEKIPYTYKVFSHSSQFSSRGSKRGNFGNFGMREDYEKQYYIYVKKCDYKKAKYAIGINLTNS